MKRKRRALLHLFVPSAVRTIVRDASEGHAGVADAAARLSHPRFAAARAIAAAALPKRRSERGSRAERPTVQPVAVRPPSPVGRALLPPPMAHADPPAGRVRAALGEAAWATSPPSCARRRARRGAGRGAVRCAIMPGVSLAPLAAAGAARRDRARPSAGCAGSGGSWRTPARPQHRCRLAAAPRPTTLAGKRSAAPAAAAGRRSGLAARARRRPRAALRRAPHLRARGHPAPAAAASSHGGALARQASRAEATSRADRRRRPLTTRHQRPGSSVAADRTLASDRRRASVAATPPPDDEALASRPLAMGTSPPPPAAATVPPPLAGRPRAWSARRAVKPATAKLEMTAGRTPPPRRPKMRTPPPAPAPAARGSARRPRMVAAREARREGSAARVSRPRAACSRRPAARSGAIAAWPRSCVAARAPCATIAGAPRDARRDAVKPPPLRQPAIAVAARGGAPARCRAAFRGSAAGRG